jgi:hypothetical protein
MPVVINEVEVFDPPAPALPGATPAPHREPPREDLRRSLQDLHARAQRLIAD